ncbi:hypothetical protein I79_004832 [Cricetulus griseus]|uniref:Uncharacterized protein n=1 Tax=Cricetulus griseus TaxID=10029 RepID=G3H3I5_CRIGR|nr:hypothetical protein I79_004832 [Cricetulus griseus]
MSKVGLSSLPFLLSWNTQLWGLLILHSRDLKAVISAPSLDKQPLPNTELHILQLSWLGIFTAHGISSNSNNSLQNRGPCHPWDYQVNIEAFVGEEGGKRDKLDHLEDLSENILLRVVRLLGWVE